MDVGFINTRVIFADIMVLRKIKQLLGMGSEKSSGRSDQDVVVQEESEPDTETEAAVKGVEDPESAEEPESDDAESADETESDDVESTEEPESDDADTDDAESVPDEDEAETGDNEADEEDEPVAAATDADASTGSLVDEAEAQEHPESRAEPAEAAGPGADDETTDVDDVDPTEESDSPDVDTGDAGAEGAPVDDIKGIGPAYSDRLGEIGVHSIDQLASADPEDIAERIAVPEKTVVKWVDRAQEQSD